MSLDSKLDYHRASNGMVFGGILIYVGGIFLLIAFISPYWEQSYDQTLSNFKHMGLWQYCFDEFRYPNHQFDKLFIGCHFIYSNEYYVIREWLLPGWLLAIQAWMTLAFLLSFGSQIIIAGIVVRFPLNFVLHYEWLLTGIIFLCNAVSTFLIFISVVLFWTQSSRRDWLMYPNFNHVSYSFYLGVIALFIKLAGSYIFYLDTRKAYEYHKESRNLVMQMHIPNSRNGFV
uniref:EXPERA domain-containing protein n=1 Tax=Clastoptera arizonana TaxID=38151 RepID=A0A1B6DPT9_9HEMI